MFCLDDPSIVSIYGDRGTAAQDSFSILELKIDRCDSSLETHKCKSEAEIDGWLNTRSFLLMYDQQSYDPDNYEDPQA